MTSLQRCDRGRRQPLRRRLLAALGALLALPPPLLAGNPQGVEFEHLTTEDGLSYSTVWDVLQDRRGFLWFATGSLLQRYDGYEFTSFQHDPADPESVTAGKILEILEDRQGILWLATRGQGIDRLDPASHRFAHFLPDPDKPGSLSDGRVHALHEDRSGVLWAGSRGGLHRFHPEDGSFTNYRHDPADPGSISSGPVWAILEDRHGELWVGSASGLDRYDRSAETFLHYRYDPDDPASLSAGDVNVIYEDPSGELWIGTGSGLDRFDRERDAFIRHSLTPGGESISVGELLEDGAGELWIGTSGAGLLRTDRAAHRKVGESRERFVHFRHDPENRHSLGSDRIQALGLDRTGILWIGHRGGVDKYDRRRERFVRYRRGDGHLAGSKVWGVTEDRSGVLWISAHNGGLTALDRRRPKRGVVSHYRHEPENPNSLLSSQPTALLADRDDELWVGHLHGGLSRMDRQRRRVVRYDHDPQDPTSLAAGTVASLLEDRSGTIWIAFLAAGVQRYAREQDAFLTYAPEAEDPLSLRSSKAYALLEDRAGNLWVGTYGGLSRFDPDSGGFVHTTHRPDDRNSLSSNNVTSVHEDGSGIFWIGTTSGGLNRWDRERDEFRHYRVQDGLPSDDVLGILEDDLGRLWLATKQGLACLDPRSGKIRRYDVDDGLHGNNFFTGPAYRSRDGELFFGGDGGVTAFFPEHIQEDPIAPAVAITDFQILNRSTPLAERRAPLAERRAPGKLAGAAEDVPHLVLDHRDDIFAFEFAALHFANPDKNRYAYRLQGFQPDWVEVDAEKRFAQYTNLDPGSYVFRVKASNGDGTWNHEGAALRITVLPPPWRTWWAYGLYLLAGTAAVAAYLGSQRRKLEHERRIAERERRTAERERAANQLLRETDQLKDEFLANTSHELRTPLYGITGIVESLIDGATGELPRATKDNLEMVVASGRRLSHLVNDILDFSKLRHQSLELRRVPVDLRPAVEVVLTLSRPLVGAKALELVNAVPGELPAAAADENRLQQILHNLVSNAVRFTESGTVEVSASAADGMLQLRVADTGIGIPEAHQERIFDAFVQADASVEREYGGTGLGLAVTRQLVELHGGTLEVESTVGVGSTFSFSLEVAAEPAPAAPAEDGGQATSRPPVGPTPALAAGDPATTAATAGETDFAPAAAGAPHVLVVDDEPVIRQVVTNQLAAHGFRMTPAASGAEALRLLREHTFELVVLDVMMPRMSGFEVCRKLRQRHSLEELPVIFLTAKNQSEDLVVGLAAGANDYLPKPVSKSELLARVRTHVALLQVNRQLSEMVSERTAQLAERQLLLGERERLIGELESRNAELARFNYTVAHDLKNPLITIRNFVGLLRTDVEKGDSDRLHGDLRRIDAAASKLQRLLEELYEFSRVDRDSMRLEEVRLDELVRQAAGELGGTFTESGVEVTVAAELPAVCGDRARLLEVVRLLLGNAVQYLGEVTAPRIEVGMRTAAAPEEPPVLYVRDNGMGIDPQYHERVFSLFERLDPEASEGTGIGLALVKRIVETHGGRVWVESEGRCRGSTFCFTLPWVERGAELQA